MKLFLLSVAALVFCVAGVLRDPPALADLPWLVVGAGLGTVLSAVLYRAGVKHGSEAERRRIFDPVRAADDALRSVQRSPRPDALPLEPFRVPWNEPEPRRIPWSPGEGDR